MGDRTGGFMVWNPAPGIGPGPASMNALAFLGKLDEGSQKAIG